MRRFRKPVNGQPLREFESPPLRFESRNPRFVRGLFHFCSALSCATVLFPRKERHYFRFARRALSSASSKAVVGASLPITDERERVRLSRLPLPTQVISAS